MGAAYQALRYSRASQIQRNARRQKTTNHYPDGPEQMKRDSQLSNPQMVRSWAWDPIEGEPTPEWNEGLFGYDSEKVSHDYFKKMGYI